MSAGAISVKQNAEQTIGLHFFDAASADIDITGKTVYLYVSLGIDQPYLIEKSITAHSNPTQGRTLVNLLAADLDLDARGYRYELWIDGQPTDIGTCIVEDTLRGDA